MKPALILPTGDEIFRGVVVDTDSPMIQKALEALGFSAAVHPPLLDSEEEIAAALESASREGYGLVILIGGSGGGHRHDPTLSHDFTHSALEGLLSPMEATGLYGKNGHLWSRLLCGYLGETLVANVPGPFREAQAAMGAFCAIYRSREYDLRELNAAMAAAVCGTYG